MDLFIEKGVNGSGEGKRFGKSLLDGGDGR